MAKDRRCAACPHLSGVDGVDPSKGRRTVLCVLFPIGEGIVAKWSEGIYQTDGRGTSWLTIKNPAGTQSRDRHELFARRASSPHRSRAAVPELRFTLGARRSLWRAIRRGPYPG